MDPALLDDSGSRAAAAEILSREIRAVAKRERQTFPSSDVTLPLS
jgi:hypothetical protein